MIGIAPFSPQAVQTAQVSERDERNECSGVETSLTERAICTFPICSPRWSLREPLKWGEAIVGKGRQLRLVRSKSDDNDARIFYVRNDELILFLPYLTRLASGRSQNRGTIRACLVYQRLLNEI